MAVDKLWIFVVYIIISVCQARLCVQPMENDVTAIKEGGEDNVNRRKKSEKKKRTSNVL